MYTIRSYTCMHYKVREIINFNYNNDRTIVASNMEAKIR